MNALRLSHVSGSSSMRQPLIPLASRHKQSLPIRVLQTLNDSSCPVEQKKNLIDYCVGWSLNISSNSIAPQNKYLLLWHSLILFIILYYVFQMGLLLCFGDLVWRDVQAYCYALNLVFIVLLSLDCVLCGFKSYYQHGLLITNRRLIIKRYVYPWFWVDLLCIVSVCVPILSGALVLNWIKVIFLLKMRTAYLIDKEFNRITQLKVSLHTFYLLCRLMMLMTLASHYLGIWFYMIDHWVYVNNYYGPNTPNLCWIYNAEAFSQMVLLLPWYGQYLYIMYFSIGTMNTIAYGDITPLNPLETLYICGALLLYTVGFGYILSQVLRILMQAQASKFEHSNNLIVVSNLMKNNRIKNKTQVKVKSYFERVWKQEIYRNRDIENELIQTLPNRIKNQLFYKLYSPFLTSIGILTTSTLSTSFLLSIADAVVEERLIQEQHLYYQNQPYDPYAPSHSVYFIKQLIKGRPLPTIQLGVADIVVATLADGAFGEEGFFTGQARNHWAKVINSVVVFYLPRNIMMEKIDEATTEQRERMFLLGQKVGRKKCLICKQQNQHEFLNCPYSTYRPDVVALLQQQSQQQKQKVQQHIFERKQKIASGKSNALILFPQIRQLKYKVKDKYRLLLSNQYYSHLLNKRGMRKQPSLEIRQIESEEESYTSSQTSSSSSNTSQDLDNYMKQTQIFIQYLQVEDQPHPQQHNPIYNIQLDSVQQFRIYQPKQNVTEVVNNFTQVQKQGKTRRKVQPILYRK